MCDMTEKTGLITTEENPLLFNCAEHQWTINMHVTVYFIMRTVAHKNYARTTSQQRLLYIPISVPLTVSVSYMCVTEL